MTRDNAPSYSMTPRPLSRLTYRIMGINIIAVLILVIGIFYLDEYRQTITNAEMELLSTETQLYASLIENAARNPNQLAGPNLLKLVKSLAEQKPQRIRVFDSKGRLRSDSGVQHARFLPLEREWDSPLGRTAEQLFATFIDIVSIHFRLPDYPDTLDSRAQNLPDAKEAMSGALSLSAWKALDGGLLLSSAAPLRIDGKSSGVVLVTRTDTSVEQTFARMRLDILRLFFLALIITVTFSLYLSGAVGHPLRRLAYAAERVRLGKSQIVDVPDLIARADEIGELAQALHTMTAELNARIDSIDRFAADVSHELKNPLTSLRSAFETLPKIKNESDQARLLSVIDHDLERMERLITDIARASRLDAEMNRSLGGFTPLRNLWHKITEQYHDPRLKLNPCPEVMVFGSPSALMQVFQNVVENALSFTPENGNVILSADMMDNQIMITIDDTGSGIPSNKLEKIFERFYSQRPEHEGFGQHSGLGLSIARQIVEKSHGTITAQNRMNEHGDIQGARFIISLKIKDDNAS